MDFTELMTLSILFPCIEETGGDKDGDGLGTELITLFILFPCIEEGGKDGDGVVFTRLELRFSKLLILIREEFPELPPTAVEIPAIPGFRGLELAGWTGLLELAPRTG